MGPEIRANGGFIDKYIGDAIMALFPSKPDDALAAAVAMQKKLLEYNADRAKSGYSPIAIGIGVNAGKLMLGTVGEHERMDGSVIADTVNLCSRLEILTRVYGSTILTTGQTLKALRDPRRFCVPVHRQGARAREAGSHPALRDPRRRERRAEAETLAYKEELARALRLYFGRSFDEALKILNGLRESNPGDRILGIYRRRCENLIALGAPAEWQGVEEIEVR